MCVCVWGGGGGGGGEYLSQVKENPNIWISVKIARLRTRIFSLSQTETLRFKPVPEAQSVGVPSDPGVASKVN